MKNLRQLLAQEGLVKSAGLSATAWDYRTHLGIEVDVQRISDLEQEEEGRWQRMDLQANVRVILKTSPGIKTHEVALWEGKAAITIESMSGDWGNDADVYDLTASTKLVFLEDLIGM